MALGVAASASGTARQSGRLTAPRVWSPTDARFRQVRRRRDPARNDAETPHLFLHQRAFLPVRKHRIEVDRREARRDHRSTPSGLEA